VIERSRPVALAAVAALALVFGGCSSCRDKTSTATEAGTAASPSGAPSTSASAVVVTKPSEPPFPTDPGSGWEGTVSFEITGAERKDAIIPMLLVIRGNRVRYDSPTRYKGRDASTIVDVALRRLVIFPQDDKEFGRVDLPPVDADAGSFPLTKSGKKLTLMGLDCDVYGQKRGKASSMACIHEGIAFVDPSMATSGLTPPAWLRSLGVSKRFVARAVEVDEEGRETFRLEVKSVAAVRNPLGVNLPSGYIEAKGKMPGSPFRPGLPN
jgi:hypothetical protein